VAGEENEKKTGSKRWEVARLRLAVKELEIRVVSHRENVQGLRLKLLKKSIDYQG